MSLETIPASISALADHIPVAGAIITVASGLVEMVLRLIKSDKPLSLAYAISAIFHGIGALFEKIGDFMDSILPQRVKDVPQDPKAPF